MKQIFVLLALLLGVCAANAQTTDTVKYAAGNDLYRGITRKLPYRQMVTPYGVEVTFAKTVHIIFPAAVRYVDLGSNHIIAGKADGAENVIRVKATTEESEKMELFALAEKLGGSLELAIKRLAESKRNPQSSRCV